MDNRLDIDQGSYIVHGYAPRKANGTDNGQQHAEPDSGSSETPGSDTREPSRLSVVNLTEFSHLQLALREFVLAPIIMVRSLVLLFAYRGVGKTQVAFNIAWAVACGQPFIRWYAPRPRRVLYIDGEMPQEQLQERAKTMMAASACMPPEPDYFRLLSMDRQALGVSINLACREHQIEIEKLLDEIDFVVIDNISTLVNGGPENDAKSWDEMQAWLLQLRRRGKTVLLVHHAGRGENARGTSKREDILDTVIRLTRPEDYEMEQGARLEVHLTKARGAFGDDALPFEARLEVIDGRDSWTCTTLRDRILDRIEELSRDGGTVREIAEDLGLSRSKVNRLQAKLRAEGRL
jgi:putative DNA primase/helicase